MTLAQLLEKIREAPDGKLSISDADLDFEPYSTAVGNGLAKYRAGSAWSSSDTLTLTDAGNAYLQRQS